jgi:hypothetical protein
MMKNLSGYDKISNKMIKLSLLFIISPLTFAMKFLTPAFSLID